MNDSIYNVAQINADKEQIAAGFERAVADYGATWVSHQTAQLIMDTAKSEMDVAQAHMDDAIDGAEAIAVDFNDAIPGTSQYEDLTYHLDATRDYMISAIENFDILSHRYWHACEQFNSSAVCIEDSFNSVRAYRSQLEIVVYSVNAANDAKYELDELLDTLSDEARYLYDSVA